ncbi:hypothetical protein LH464_23330 [Neorhizobium sp. T786]|uniref:ClpX C4-type zinc finger protein n=1 Tax=Pseudorhizobium xiangyangii TaxID=2883104 RepID=UPI001CFF7C92|nr:ClpX C4-type zinc finger protein [Neorhizobium xiangyangii]MCB5205397.1 hypothetical protein [Neorhizobium xiangyangii]
MTKNDQPKRSAEKRLFFCSFCDKSTNDVATMIAGPTTFICDECIELCLSMMTEAAAKADAEQQDKDVGLPGGHRKPNAWGQRQAAVWAKTVLRQLPKSALTDLERANALDFLTRITARIIEIGYERGAADEGDRYERDRERQEAELRTEGEA